MIRQGLRRVGRARSRPIVEDGNTKGLRRFSEIAETQMSRYKQILGDTLRARTLPNQQTETRVGCAVLNRLLALAKPESYPITKKA